MKRRPNRLWWVPVAVALGVGVVGNGVILQPARLRVSSLTRTLDGLHLQAQQARMRLAEDAQVNATPLPIEPTALDQLWPQVIAAATSYGYRVDLLSFSDATTNGIHLVTLTMRMKGPYLGLDPAVESTNRLLPLWTWRTMQISNPEGPKGIDVIATGVLPMAGSVMHIGGPGDMRGQPSAPGVRRDMPEPPAAPIAPPGRSAP